MVELRELEPRPHTTSHTFGYKSFPKLRDPPLRKGFGADLNLGEHSGTRANFAIGYHDGYRMIMLCTSFERLCA